MYPLQGQVQQILKHVEHSHDFLTIIYLNKVTPPHALTLNATPQFANLTPKEPKGSIPSNQYKHRKGSNLSLSRLLYIPTFELVSMGKSKQSLQSLKGTIANASVILLLLSPATPLFCAKIYGQSNVMPFAYGSLRARAWTVEKHAWK